MAFFSSMREEGLPDAPIYNVELQAVLRKAKNQLDALEFTIRQCPLAFGSESNLSVLHNGLDALPSLSIPRLVQLDLFE
jgi:hypothetical protein